MLHLYYKYIVTKALFRVIKNTTFVCEIFLLRIETNSK